MKHAGIAIFGMIAGMLVGCHEEGGGSSKSGLGDLFKAQSTDTTAKAPAAPKAVAPAKPLQPLRVTPTRGPSVVQPLVVKPSRGPSPLQPTQYQPTRVQTIEVNNNRNTRTAVAQPVPIPPAQSGDNASWWHTWFSKQPK